MAEWTYDECATAAEKPRRCPWVGEWLDGRTLNFVADHCDGIASAECDEKWRAFVVEKMKQAYEFASAGLVVAHCDVNPC